MNFSTRSSLKLESLQTRRNRSVGRTNYRHYRETECNHYIRTKLYYMCVTCSIYDDIVHMVLATKIQKLFNVNILTNKLCNDSEKTHRDSIVILSIPTICNETTNNFSIHMGTIWLRSGFDTTLFSAFEKVLQLPSLKNEFHPVVFITVNQWYLRS